MKLPIQTTQVWGLFAVAALSLTLAMGSARTSVVQQAVSASPVTRLPAVDQSDTTPATVPDFSAYSDIARRKRAFYHYLLPKIREANAEVMAQRDWLLDVAGRLVGGQSLTNEQLIGLVKLEKQYAVEPRGDLVRQVRKLLRRVDVVPASLVLAQAAKESGWGTSRFAVEGKNFFGIWCFSNGCGIRPQRRDAGHTHEVAEFDSVAEGVRYYIRTLNTLPAYHELRGIRARARRQHQLAPGDELAQGLIRYSARGVAYVKEIQSMIQHNNLHRFTLGHQEA